MSRSSPLDKNGARMRFELVFVPKRLSRSARRVVKFRNRIGNLRANGYGGQTRDMTLPSDLFTPRCLSLQRFIDAGDRRPKHSPIAVSIPSRDEAD